jgi:WD40 repeat protein
VFEVYPEDTNYILSSGHWDGSVHIALLDEFVSPNLPVLRIRQSLAAHRLPVTCVALSESLFLTGSMDNTAALWNVTYERKQLKIDPRPLYTISGHSAPLSAVALSKALDLIVTASEDGLLMIHQLDLKRNRTRAVLRHPRAHISKLVVAASGYIICYCQGPRLLYCYSLNGEKLAEKNLFDGEEAGDGLAQLLVSKSSRLVLCAEGSTIVFRCTPTLDIIHILYADNKDSSISSLKLSEDERVLFVGYRDGSLTFVTLPDWNSGDVDL